MRLYESQVIQEDQQDGNGHYPSYREQIECNHRPLDTFGVELRLLIAVTGENPADEDRHSHGSERHHDAGGYLVVEVKQVSHHAQRNHQHGYRRHEQHALVPIERMAGLGCSLAEECHDNLHQRDRGGDRGYTQQSESPV